MSSSAKASVSSFRDDHENHYAMIHDEKKRRRMMSNRESARRSRMKKEQHVKDLNEETTCLSSQIARAARKTEEVKRRHDEIKLENEFLRMQSEELKRRLELLDEMVVSFSRDANGSENDQIYFDNDILPHYSVQSWMQTPFQAQEVDGIYHF